MLFHDAVVIVDVLVMFGCVQLTRRRKEIIKTQRESWQIMPFSHIAGRKLPEIIVIGSFSAFFNTLWHSKMVVKM